MKKLFLLTILILVLSFITPSISFAQGMMGNYYNSSGSASASDIRAQQQEEQEGKSLLDQINNKSLTCQKVTDDQFEKIGEYFMGQSIGNTQTHIDMNNQMKSMMGEQGESQMHIAWGKRGSGCDSNAQFTPNTGGGGFPMMGYGGWNNWNNMMGWGGFGFGWIFMIVFWILIILGVVALVRHLRGTNQNGGSTAPLNILKERYAKGEINKKEFEEMKKDLN